jgi:hypothetical protein
MFFLTPKATIEEAQADYEPALFNPAAVFETPDGYVMGLLRDLSDWPPHKAAQALLDTTGYKMVSCCDPLLSVWKPYVPAATMRR